MIPRIDSRDPLVLLSDKRSSLDHDGLPLDLAVSRQLLSCARGASHDPKASVTGT